MRKNQRNALRVPGVAERSVLLVIFICFSLVSSKFNDDVARFKPAVTRAIVQ